MGKIRKTYSKEYQLDVVKKDLYEGWTKCEIMHPFHISSSMLHRWMTHYKMKGIQGLEEKRSKTKITAWLRKKYNLTINHKRVYRLMKELGIQANIRRKRKYVGKKEAYVV
jgi:transposase